MSFEILVGKTTISGATAQLLAQNAAEFLMEHIPELSVVTHGKDSTSSSNYNYKYALAFDGLPCGLWVYATYDSPYVDIFAITPIKISGSTASGTSAASYNTVIPNRLVINGSTTYTVSIAIAKAGAGYVISVGSLTVYIGYLNSTLAGTIFAVANLGQAAYQSQSANSYGITAFTNGGGTYYAGTIRYISPWFGTIPIGSAVLSPVYMVVNDFWVEPLLLPGIYYMTAGNHPDLFQETQIAGVDVVMVSDKIAIV